MCYCGAQWNAISLKIKEAIEKSKHIDELLNPKLDIGVAESLMTKKNKTPKNKKKKHKIKETIDKVIK